MRTSLAAIAALAGATGLLLAAGLHYPLATTFPLGGDAPSYIRDSRRLLTALTEPAALVDPTTYSRYPLMQASFALFAALPLNWAERYTWFAAVAFVAAGVALSLLARRIAGWPAAVVALALWSTTLVGVQSHIEDGTIAQLLSLAPLFLLLERLYARSYRLASLALVAALLTHVMTGVVGLLAAYTAIIVGWNTDRSVLRRLALPVAAITALAAAALASVHTFFSHVPGGDRTVSFPDSIRSWIAPVWILAPAGLVLVLSRLRQRPVGVAAVVALALVALITTFNERLGLSVWTFRFATYLISTLLLLASLAVPALLRQVTPERPLRALTALLLILPMFTAGWMAASEVFAYHESPSRYARLHDDERAAFAWMAEHLPAGSAIVSTEENRHTEWIPIFTPHRWDGVPGTIPAAVLTSGEYTHAIYLLKREDVPEFVQADFLPVYETSAAIIYRLTP